MSNDEEEVDDFVFVPAKIRKQQKLNRLLKGPQVGCMCQKDFLISLHQIKSLLDCCYFHLSLLGIHANIQTAKVSSIAKGGLFLAQIEERIMQSLFTFFFQN